MNCRKTLIAGGAAAFASLLAGAAGAQTTDIPNCDDTAMFPNPIYLSGSSAFRPTAGNMAVKLSTLTGTEKATIIYKATSSCDGPASIEKGTMLMGTGEYFTLDTSTPPKVVRNTCNLEHTPTKADVGIADIFYENCPGNPATYPATMTDVKGPVQAMIFIVPASNTTNTNLTAEEAQDIWGCGAAGLVTPFVSDQTDTQQRNSGSGTQGVVAAAIKVPPAAFKGKTNDTGDALVASLGAAPNQNAAIGFLAADSFDTKRGTLNALAFRAFNQTKAYYADSTNATFDKKNVRDGHYVVWGPEHFFAAYDSTTKTITNQKAANFIGWVNGTTPTTAFNYVQVEAASGVIPQCAMKVSRAADGGLLSPFTPNQPCGCYFESVANKTATPAGCTACNADTDCTGANAGKHCLNKFCE
jgi:hypothetical protein